MNNIGEREERISKIDDTIMIIFQINSFFIFTFPIFINYSISKVCFLRFTLSVGILQLCM
ncbi:hypothetical protein A2334_05445 [Candidatus Roizmanbacteria bacterium RIFOXYB2_FULL_38_10]|uniref:Uncharacterized protein n=1 Tax=Candidatus Roizmanbacteria bacterium RIFOXYD1_FULL_38_12 TaxID=1802093 RepID=A0A1F7L0R9_9BACT|nr:MAG: hypothetical protein A3K47_02565 [Candidatus Roizmanbacteria bacterium RIFOXYA2_FULL_38_14]OGK63651.1 MAG: hypothetical protein A3K27_02565 [Candidatus Roizmanbacteria bacterium RIFOXYA1_FULL_37_12]OGK65497.1 MAG: hypothetical protein A3K38_02565 [Candidatus Roizmanbacteria bacterium RIFOXYB1_FULL_40_23]OGK68282.1 MAG: hypothetical protein A2334_05445 [Candidatus Roizmanbacteria bacterium RIFOXYB2_FULL_38_10]OGK69902.1 MAG: hypothetical protein A3K21_02570 [Candidatus Roizmanbacteria ba